jgi:hypothetical protein
MRHATAARPFIAKDASERRLAMGVLVSLLLHALVLSLQFGIPGLRPGPGGPITVRLTTPAVSAPVPVPPPQVPALPPAIVAPAPAAVAPLPLSPVRPVTPRHGFTLVDPVVPVPAPAPAPPPRRVAKRRRKPPATRLADGLHTRVIAQEAHQDTTFEVPLPAVEPDPAAEPMARAEPPAEADAPVEDDAMAQEAARAERTRLAEERERERALRRDADEARLRADVEDRLRAEAAQQRQRLAEQSAQYDTALAEQHAAEEAQARARQEEEERRLAEQRRLQQAEQEHAQQLAEQQRLRQAEQERAQQLAEQRRIQQAEQERAQQLAEQQRVQQAEQARAQQLAEQRRAEEVVRQQLADQERARRLAEERARQEQAEAEQAARRQAEENARLAQEQARQARERAVADAPARAGVDGGSGAGTVRGNGALPRGALGSDLASRAREMMRGIDISTPVPRAVQPAEDAARAVRRALAEAARHDIPLRMYMDSVRQKIERNAVLSDAQLSVDIVRTDPVVSVAIRSDGSVEDVTILRSSGRADIDDFVRRIVRLNARYSAFPPNVAANYDVIELRRVWRFAGVLRLMEEMR